MDPAKRILLYWKNSRRITRRLIRVENEGSLFADPFSMSEQSAVKFFVLKDNNTFYTIRNLIWVWKTDSIWLQISYVLGRVFRCLQSFPNTPLQQCTSIRSKIPCTPTLSNPFFNLLHNRNCGFVNLCYCWHVTQLWGTRFLELGNS